MIKTAALELKQRLLESRQLRAVLLPIRFRQDGLTAGLIEANQLGLLEIRVAQADESGNSPSEQVNSVFRHINQMHKSLITLKANEGVGG